MLKANPKLYMPINLFICTVSFLFALPATIAVFPQMSKVSILEWIFLKRLFFTMHFLIN